MLGSTVAKTHIQCGMSSGLSMCVNHKLHTYICRLLSVNKVSHLHRLNYCFTESKRSKKRNKKSTSKNTKQLFTSFFQFVKEKTFAKLNKICCANPVAFPKLCRRHTLNGWFSKLSQGVHKLGVSVCVFPLPPPM